MSLLIGIDLSSGQISSVDAANKKLEAKHFPIKKGYVDDKNMREKLIQAKTHFGNVGIVRTIFVMPAHCKTEDRKNLLTVASELGFGKCGIISNEAANCITSITKFKLKLKESERIAIITKEKRSQKLICHYWQKIGRQIKSYQKPFFVDTERKEKQLKQYLKKYANVILIGENVDVKSFAHILNEKQHEIMKHSEYYWSSSALLKAGMIYWKTSKSIKVTDFIEKNFKIQYNGKTLKVIERPCLPFKTNIPLTMEANENAVVEVFQGDYKIATLQPKTPQANIQFSINHNGIVKLDVGAALPRQNNNFFLQVRMNALRLQQNNLRPPFGPRFNAPRSIRQPFMRPQRNQQPSNRPAFSQRPRFPSGGRPPNNRPPFSQHNPRFLVGGQPQRFNRPRFTGINNQPPRNDAPPLLPERNVSLEENFINLQFALWEEDAAIAAVTVPEIIQTFECIVCFVEYDEDDGCFKCSYWAKGNPNKSHAICRECLQGHAEATIYNTPIVPEADGIPCVEHGCENVLNLANIREYLSIETAEALIKRMQRENFLLVSENVDDFFQCEICDHCGWIDKSLPTFICECGDSMCSSCFRLYDKDHEGKTCAEVVETEKKNKKQLNVNEQLSECVIRKCPKCGNRFVKETGCNKMTCRCGAKSCYICEASITDYVHFCRCENGIFGRNPCPHCQKTCRLFEDAEAFDQNKIRNILDNQSF